MSKEREALKLALEALESNHEEIVHDWALVEKNNQAITAIKEALAQPEQKPVADIDGDEFDAHFRKRINVYADEHPALLVRQLARRLRKEWNTTPPQRTWVGLTDEESILLIENDSIGRGELIDIVTAKLKEKNT